MALKLSTGPYLNHLTRVLAAQITTSPSMLATFPKANAYDERASLPAQFSAGADDSYIRVDTDLLGASGTFETDVTDIAAWSVLGVGAIDRNAGNPHAGTFAMRISPSEPTAIVYKDVLVRPGEELTLRQFTMPDATSIATRIRNRQTGKWLKSDGTWDASQQDLDLNITTSSYTEFTKTFTVEDTEACQRDLVTLRLSYEATGLSWVDDVTLYPSTDWCSVHAHNIPPAIVPTLQYSDDDSSWSTQSTMALRRDSFNLTISTLQAHRYWRLLLDGQVDAASLMFVGEMILAQHFDSSRLPAYDGTITWLDKQTRLTSALGEEFVHHHGLPPCRKLAFEFATINDAQYHELHKLIFRASRGGGYPIVLAMSELDEEVVIYGRVRESIAFVKSTPGYRTTSLEVQELALASAPDVAGAYDAPIIEEE